MKSALSLLVGAAAAASQALVIVGWTNERGGFSSFPESGTYGRTRDSISLAFPGTVFTSVGQITPEALEGADVVWIGVNYSDNRIVPLISSTEQNALLQFVNSGHMAMLFGENDTFTTEAPAANAALMSPFGAHLVGTLGDSQTHTPYNPGSFPVTGPFGGFTSLVSGYPGWFDSLPNYAVRILRLDQNQNTSMATYPPGTFSPGSGRVWLFSDSGGQSDGGSHGDDWNNFYCNMLSEVAKRVHGTINLQDWGQSEAGQMVQAEIYSGTTLVHSESTSLSAGGAYSVNFALTAGNYSVRIKGSHWLARSSASIPFSGYGTLEAGTLSLLNGDVDGDNEVGLSDFGVLSAAFGAFDGDPGYVSGADLDGDGEVGLSDFGILSQNFGEIGD